MTCVRITVPGPVERSGTGDAHRVPRQLDDLICNLARMVRMTAQLMTDTSDAKHRGDLTQAEEIIANQAR